ncbi:HAD family phosphatase [bacterium]|nr:HAD family phosphatase [bacterium]
MSFNPAQISAVVFDMDGVLLDTEILYKKVTFIAAEQFGFAMTEELHLSTVGVPADGSEKIMRAGMPQNFPFEEFDAAWRKMLKQELHKHVPVKSGVVDLLTWLNANNVPAAVATSTDFEAAHDHLKRADLAKHFSAIVTRGDVQQGKPHPEPFLTAAARLSMDPEDCLALEDSHNGVRAAHAAGMKTVMVPDLLAPTDEIRALCSGVASNLAEIERTFRAHHQNG